MYFVDRVLETSTTTGSGNFTLAGAVTGYQTFNAAFGTGSAAMFFYCIVGVDAGGVPTGEWEAGRGHLSASTTLVRDTFLASSSGSTVNFSAGTKNVFADAAAAYYTSPFRACSNARDIMANFGTGITAATQFISLFPVVLEQGMVCRGVAAVFTATATTHMSGGLYDASGTAFAATNLLADGGASPITSLAVGINLLPFTTPYTVPNDMLAWYGWNNQGATITMPTGDVGAGRRAFVARVGDTWPNPIGALTLTGSGGMAWLY